MDIPQYEHKSVLVSEVLEYLDPKPGGVYLDATFGGGGHTRALLEHEPGCSVIGLDWDTAALEARGSQLEAEYPDRLRLLWGNFALLYKIIKKEKIPNVDGILADFGTSQYQITNRPGFSVYRDTPLDMRMSPAHQRITAADVLNTSEEEKLRQLFWQLGEEQFAKKIVQRIVEERKHSPFKTTGQLVDIIESVIPKGKRKIHPATKVFQALRIYVNKELDNIQAFLAASLRILKPGGRLVCISFHSLEDRIVKNFFNEQEQPMGPLKILTPKPVTAGDEELQANPSARSAKLRAAEYVPVER